MIKINNVKFVSFHPEGSELKESQIDLLFELCEDLTDSRRFSSPFINQTSTI